MVLVNRNRRPRPVKRQLSRPVMAHTCLKNALWAENRTGNISEKNGHLSYLCALEICAEISGRIVVFLESPADRIEQARRVLPPSYEASVTFEVKKYKFSTA